MRRQRPHQTRGFGRFIGRLYLRLAGWKLEGALPEGVPKAVVVAAPHTTNWDMPHMLAVAFSLGVRVSWLGKKQLFRWPFGGFMEVLGGVPVDRRAPQGLVGQCIEAFDEAEGLMLVIPPSGTRGRAERWKSGFYHIAAGARVPILLSFLDYGRRVGGLGPAIMPSGDISADMDQIRAFYAGVTAAYPEKTSEMRLAEEDEPAAASGGG